MKINLKNLKKSQNQTINKLKTRVNKKKKRKIRILNSHREHQQRIKYNSAHFMMKMMN
jgi:hypothetical protein